MREWEPGDVAGVTYPDGSTHVAFRRCCPGGWAVADGEILEGSKIALTARPLIVIDPEDTEQTQRLTDAVRDALRSLADSPAPPGSSSAAVVARVEALADEWQRHPYALVSGNPITRLRAALRGDDK